MYSDNIELRPPTLKEIKYMFEHGIIKQNECTDYAERRQQATSCIWLNDRSIFGKQLAYSRYFDETYSAKMDDIFGFLPVIDATTDLVDVFGNGKLPLGMFPTKEVWNDKELNEHLRAGDLIFTEKFYGRCPVFKYKDKCYLFADDYFMKDFKYEYEADSSQFEYSSFSQRKKYLENCRNSLLYRWYEVEELHFKYIKELNIFVHDREILNINYYKGLNHTNSYKRMVKDILTDPLYFSKPFGTINDYLDLDNISVVYTNDTNSYTDFSKIGMPIIGQKHIVKFKVNNEMKKDFVYLNNSDNKNTILYGEYPQTELINVKLNGEKTGKQYSLMNANGGIELIDEYIDLTLGIKYVKVDLDFYDKYYKVEPIEWKLKDNYIIADKVLFNKIVEPSVSKYIAFCFKKEIIPSNVKPNVHEVINSNIGYQLLMNKNNINESDLELDADDRLVLKRGNK